MSCYHHIMILFGTVMYDHLVYSLARIIISIMSLP